MRNNVARVQHGGRRASRSNRDSAAWIVTGKADTLKVSNMACVSRAVVIQRSILHIGSAHPKKGKELRIHESKRAGQDNEVKEGVSKRAGLGKNSGTENAPGPSKRKVKGTGSAPLDDVHLNACACPSSPFVEEAKREHWTKPAVPPAEELCGSTFGSLHRLHDFVSGVLPTTRPANGACATSRQPLHRSQRAVEQRARPREQVPRR